MQLFETPRLVVRPLSYQDLTALAEILRDPEVMKYSVRGVCDEDATRDFIGWCLKCYSSHRLGPWALVEKISDKFIGFCGVSPEIVSGVEEINLGYRLARSYWHHGFATEAVKGVIEYVFEQERRESVVVLIEPEHAGSIRVAEKAGFVEYSLQQFHKRQVRLYRMTRQHWKLRN
ncbi:GNAT family N-acetyltransferase [Agarivorans sp. Toyoura001]|uniref:GNAT family N-acetyltransferase n=1 Tax=unclassified Agarivorans TaxID=2636026 RepID=UPI0010D3E665|nr:GNAT family N-acetyltransferase [Agarivorans sp. Toyoura001]GDY24496.1 N-acetyltransferase [Agarivorans sp. Toyoura001]